MKKLPITTTLILLTSLLTIPLVGCASQPSVSAIHTAVAGTLTAAPSRPVSMVTSLVEVTRLVAVSATVPTGPAASHTPTTTSTPTTTQTATETVVAQATDTPGVTITPGTPLYMTLQFFATYYYDLTGLQQSAFAATLPGKTISWYALVENITPDGLVIMQFPYGLNGSVILDDVPNSTAKWINLGDQVEFAGMIQSFDMVLGTVELSNVTILNFYPAPTSTETVTPTAEPGHHRH